MNAKKRVINLYHYDVSDKDNSDLVLIPTDNLPAMYFKKKKPLDLIGTLEDVAWSTDLKFDTHVTQDQYNEFVDWWFDNMSVEFTDTLSNVASNAIDIGFDLVMSVNKARTRMKIVRMEERKSKLGKYLYEWVVKGVAYWIKKNRKDQ